MPSRQRRHHRASRRGSQQQRRHRASHRGAPYVNEGEWQPANHPAHHYAQLGDIAQGSLRPSARDNAQQWRSTQARRIRKRERESMIELNLQEQVECMIRNLPIVIAILQRIVQLI